MGSSSTVIIVWTTKVNTLLSNKNILNSKLNSKSQNKKIRKWKMSLRRCRKWQSIKSKLLIQISNRFPIWLRRFTDWQPFSKNPTRIRWRSTHLSTRNYRNYWQAVDSRVWLSKSFFPVLARISQRSHTSRQHRD